MKQLFPAGIICHSFKEVEAEFEKLMEKYKGQQVKVSHIEHADYPHMILMIGWQIRKTKIWLRVKRGTLYLWTPEDDEEAVAWVHKQADKWKAFNQESEV
jgi:hypothetical protein